jgi:hypothetical protein
MTQSTWNTDLIAKAIPPRWSYPSDRRLLHSANGLDIHVVSETEGVSTSDSNRKKSDVTFHLLGKI